MNGDIEGFDDESIAKLKYEQEPKIQESLCFWPIIRLFFLENGLYKHYLIVGNDCIYIQLLSLAKFEIWNKSVEIIQYGKER